MVPRFARVLLWSSMALLLSPRPLNFQRKSHRGSTALDIVIAVGGPRLSQQITLRVLARASSGVMVTAATAPS